MPIRTGPHSGDDASDWLSTSGCPAAESNDNNLELNVAHVKMASSHRLRPSSVSPPSPISMQSQRPARFTTIVCRSFSHSINAKRAPSPAAPWPMCPSILSDRPMARRRSGSFSQTRRSRYEGPMPIDPGTFLDGGASEGHRLVALCPHSIGHHLVVPWSLPGRGA